MIKRPDQQRQLATGLKWICAVLGLVLIVQFIRLGMAKDPWDNTESNSMLIEPLASGSAENNRSGPTAAGSKMPSAIQARVQAIHESEVFGPVPRPLPMALLGIAGLDAIIRTPTGQSGLLRENEEMGGVRLMKIGINRVLVEHQGKKTELTLFEGLGGESLLSKEESK